MKMLKVATLGVLALATVGTTFATTVKVTGSSAFRKSTYAAIVESLTAGHTKTVSAAFTGNTAFNSANQAIFKNNVDVVQCCFAGSVGGVNWLVNNTPVATAIGGNTSAAWMASTNATATVTSTATGGVSGGLYIASPTFEGPSAADVSMSDSLQDSTAFGPSNGFAALDDYNVGVVTFVMAKGKKFSNVGQANYDRLQNMSLLQFQNLAATGYAPLSMFTSNVDDTGILVALLGRDNDSGTRLATFAESMYGTVDQTCVQYKALDTAGAAITASGKLVSSLAVWGPSSNNGYASGGHVKGALQCDGVAGGVTLNGLPVILVSYVGYGDTPGAAQELKWNGCPYTFTDVILGHYSFWTYQHLFTKPALAAAKKAIAQSIGDVLTVGTPEAGDVGFAGFVGINLSDMQVDRYGPEGTVINPR